MKSHDRLLQGEPGLWAARDETATRHRGHVKILALAPRLLIDVGCFLDQSIENPRKGIKETSVTNPEPIRHTDMRKPYRRVLSASTLKGDAVKNRSGEDLGKIDEIMIDVPTGRVAYAVLSFGGVLNMGNKLFAVPWSVLTLDEDEKEFILDVPKERLENAPGFDKDNWPDMADQTWAREIDDYYGAEPYTDTTSTERTFRGGG